MTLNYLSPATRQDLRTRYVFYKHDKYTYTYILKHDTLIFEIFFLFEEN